MQAISVKYIGPTDSRGSRVKATAMYSKKSATLGWDAALNRDENFALAVKALCKKMDWHGQLNIGEGDRGEGIYVFHILNNNGRYIQAEKLDV